MIDKITTGWAGTPAKGVSDPLEGITLSGLAAVKPASLSADEKFVLVSQIVKDLAAGRYDDDLGALVRPVQLLTGKSFAANGANGGVDREAVANALIEFLANKA